MIHITFGASVCKAIYRNETIHAAYPSERNLDQNPEAAGCKHGGLPENSVEDGAFC